MFNEANNISSAYMVKDCISNAYVLESDLVLSNEKLIAEITLPADIVFKNKGKITSLKNLINNDYIKVNVSLQDRTMNLRIAPYQTIWLEL